MTSATAFIFISAMAAVSLLWILGVYLYFANRVSHFTEKDKLIIFTMPIIMQWAGSLLTYYFG